jgi:hypothetical protein
MRQKLLLSLLVIGFTLGVSHVFAQTTLRQVDFQSASNYTLDTAEYTVNTNQYLNRFTSASEGTSHDLGTAGVTPITGTEGTSYLALEFLKTGGAFTERVLTVNSVSVTGYNTINLAFLLAAPGSGYDPGPAGPGTAADWIRVEYSFDGGAWNTVIGYAGVAAGNVFKTDPNLDFDGADGTLVSANLTDNSFGITKGPTDVTLSVRFRFVNTAAAEEFVLDNIRITGTADAVVPVASAPTSAAQTLKGGTTSTSTVQSTKAGSIYLVQNGTPATTIAQLNTAIAGNKAFLGKSSASAATPYTVTPTSNLLNGVYDIVAVDIAGNLSIAVGGWLTVDNTAPTPSAPISTAQSLKSGATSTSNVQSTEAGNIYLVLNGELSTTQAQITTAISSNKGFLGKGSAVAATPYTVTLPASLVDGVYNIIAVDVPGNISTPLGGWLTVDNTAPTNQDAVLAASTFAQSGGTVTIVSSGSATNSVWLAPSGTSSFSASATMTTAGGTATSILAPTTAGTYKLYVIDAAGNISVESTASVTIDNAAPTASAPTSTAQSLKSGATSTSTVQSDEAGNIYLIKTGTPATTQAQIDAAVTGNNGFLGKSSAVATTPYTVTVAAGLNNGLYDIVAVDIAGNVSPVISGWLTVDNTPPTASAPTSAAQTLKSGTLSTSTVQSSEAGNIYLVLHLEAATTQAEINTAIGSNKAFLGQGSATAATPYTVTPAASLVDGVYDIVAVDNAGNVSSIVGGWLTMDNTAPTTQNAVFGTTSAVTPGSSVGIGSSGTASNTVWFAPSGTTNFVANATTITQAASGTATLITAPTTEGDYKLFVLDAAGNISTASTATLSVASQASAFVFSAAATATTQIKFSWTAGGGGNRVVLVKTVGASSASNYPLVDGFSALSPNLAFGSGTDLNAGGGGNGIVQCVFDGSTNGPITVTGLTVNTSYVIEVYEYAGAHLYVRPALSVTRSTANNTNPTTASTLLTFTSITNNAMTVQFTQGGNGSSIVLVARGGSSGGASPGAVSFVPADGVSYTANLDYSAGTDLGSGDKVIAYRADGASGTPIAITGLSPDAIYTFAVYEMNGTQGNGSENYSTVTLTGNRNTEPSTQTSGFSFTGISETGMTLNWTTPGNGDGRVVVIRSGSAVATDPSDLTTYTASGNFNFGVTPGGTAIGAGFLVFDNTAGSSVAITNLLPGTTYHFAAYEFNNTTSQPVPNKIYLTPGGTSSQATNSDATSPTAGTVGSLTTAGGTVVAGYWNATNTSLQVVVPLTNTDGTLDGGHVQIRLKMTGGAFADVPGTGSSTITSAERAAGTKTVTVSAADLEATAGFSEGNLGGSSGSETKFLIISAKAFDLTGNGSADYTQSSTQLDVDQTPPTITASTFVANHTTPPGNDTNYTTCNGTARTSSSNTEFIHLSMSEALGLADGTQVSVGSPGFAASAGAFDVTCTGDNRGATVYHAGNFIHLKSNTDGDWDGNTTFSFASGGSNVKDVAGNELGSVPTIVPGDATPPALATGIVFSPNGAGPETLTFQLDETLNAAVTNNVTGFTVSAAGLNTGLNNYTSGTKTVTLTSTSDGQWTDAVTVTYTQSVSATAVKDPANNQLVAFGGAAPAPAEPVFLTSVHMQSNNGTNTAFATAGNTITLTFTVARALASTPVVTFYGVTPATTVTGPVGLTYTATLLMTAGMAETVVPFQIDVAETLKTTTTTATTDGSTVTFDKTIPATPALPDLANGQDTGSSNTDNYTSTNTSISFSGIAGSVENNSTVKLYRGGSTLIGTTTASGTGAWTIVVPSLADGTYSITAQSNDAAGNLSVASAALSVTIDSSVPAAVTAFDLDAADDTGVSSTDNITKNTSNLTITGTSEINTPVSIYVDAGFVTTVTSDGSGAWTADLTLTAGIHAINATQTDLAGNVSLLNATSLSITVDITAPSAAGLTPDLNAADDSGQSSTDNITKNTSNLTFTSAAVEANAYVQLFDGASGLTTVQADNAGIWTNDISLTAGSTHSVTFKVTDAAGNTSGASPTLSVTVDTSAPSITPISIVSNNTTNTAFSKPGDKVTVTYTSNETLASSGGFAPAGIIDGVGATNSLTGPSVYSFFTTMSASNTEAALAFSFDVYDVAGNLTSKSVTTDASSVTFDKTQPSATTIDISSPVVSWSDANATSGPTLKWLVTFNDAVTGVDASDFDLYRNGSPAVSGGDLTFTTPIVVTGSGSSYTVTLNNVTLNSVAFDAQLYINLKNNSSIVDGAGNILTSALNSTIAYPGTSTPGIGLNNDYYTVIFPEPSDAAITFSAPTQTPIDIGVQWFNPTSPITPANYYWVQIKKHTASFVAPADGHLFDQTDFDFSDGTLSYFISNDSDPMTFDFKSQFGVDLASGTDYDIKITAANYSGFYNGNYYFDYQTSSTLDGTASTTVAPASTMQLLSSPVSVGSIKNDNLNSVSVMQFKVFDDSNISTNWSSDNAPFKFSGLTINRGTANDVALNNWTQIIGGAELTDGTTTIPGDVFGSTIVFPAASYGGPIPSTLSTDFGFIADANGANSSKTYTLNIWLLPTLNSALASTVDGLKLDFKINPADFALNNTSNSQKSSTFLGTQTFIESGGNPVDVTATKLAYNSSGPSPVDTNPQTSIGVGTPFSQSASTQPKVYALDANNNLDLGYTQTGNIDTPAPGNNLNPSITSQSFAGGILNLTNLKLNAAGTSVIRVQASGVTSISSTNPVTAVISSKTTISDATLPGSELASFTSITNSLPGAPFNFDFTVTDDAGADAVNFTDNDKLPTLIQKIIITQSTNNGTNGGGDPIFDDWTNSILGAQLTDGTNSVTISPGANITGSSLIFAIPGTSSMKTVAELTPKTYQLRIWVKNPVNTALQDILDNKDFAFHIDEGGITIDPSANVTSTFAPSTTESGDGRNVVTVTATKLAFTRLPNLVQSYDAEFSTSPVVRAQDANGNLDRGYTGTPTVTTVPVVATGRTYPILAGTETLVNTLGKITFDSIPAAFTVTSSGGGFSGDLIRLMVSGGLNDSGGTPTAALTDVLQPIQMNYSGNSDIIKDPTFITSGTAGNSYTSDILYINYQSSSFSANTDGVALERFLLRDGGVSHNDTDGSPTKLQTITLNISNYTYLKTVALYDGATKIAELPVSGNINTSTGDILFNSLAAFQANDDLSKAITVYATFNDTGIDDNQSVNVKVVGVTPAGVSSSFNASGTSTSFATLTGNDNKIEVVATQLDFTTQPDPTNISTYTNIDNPYMVVSARDANANLDLDYNGTVGTITNTGTTGSGTVPPNSLVMNNVPAGNFVNGIFDFQNYSTFQFTEDSGPGTIQLKVTVTTNNQLAALPTLATSSAFKVAASFESWVTGAHHYFPSYTEPTNIDYINYPETINLTASNSFEMTRLAVGDGDADGVAGDIDGANTVLTNITLGVNNYKAIRRMALYDENNVEIVDLDSTVFANISGNFATITFNGLNIVAQDDNIAPYDDHNFKMFRVRASFKNNAVDIVDNTPIQLSIVSATLGGGSRFYPGPLLPSDPLYVAYIAGNDPNNVTAPPTVNNIEVTATRLDFTTLPVGAPFLAGINEPIIAPVVKARDANRIVDLDYDITNLDPNYQTASISGAVATTSLSSFNFNQGVLAFPVVPNGGPLTGSLFYTRAGLGTLTVTTPTGLSSATNGSIPSPVINVIHVTATEATGGVITTNNIAGGSVNKVIFGVTFRPQHTVAGHPKLEQFKFTFSNPIAGVFKTIRVFESQDNSYSNTDVEVTNGSIGGKITAGSNFITIDFTQTGGIRRDFTNAIVAPNGELSYFLMVDVEATASGSTPSVTPQMIDAGYLSSTDANTKITFGSLIANVVSTKTYSFASIFPPVLTSSYPVSGQLNVDPNQPTIDLTFSVPVWSLDQTISLHDKTTGTVTPLSAGNGVYPAIASSNANLASPLQFNIPPGTMVPDHVYYVTIAPGDFNGVSATNNIGIMDEAGNVFAGISYSGTLYFKTANPNPPVLLNLHSLPIAAPDPAVSDVTLSGATINATFDQRGKAYFLVVNHLDPKPSLAEISDPLNSTTYAGGSPVIARGSFQINQTTTITQFGLIRADLTANNTYDVWMYAANDALPTPFPTADTYGSLADQFGVGAPTMHPTFSFTVPNTGLTTGPQIPITDISICKDSYQVLNKPLVINENALGDFSNNGAQTGLQTLNLLLPSGFQFDVTTQSHGAPLYGDLTLSGDDFTVGSGSLKFINSSTLKVSFINSGTSTRDNITISGLRVIAPDVSSGSITRLGGNALTNFVLDEDVIATIHSGISPEVDFGNSYAANVFPEKPIAVTTIPDNYNEPLFTVTLIPNLPAGDYGSSKFTGQGVNVDQLNLPAVTLNTPFNIVHSHTDNNGCVSQSSAQYNVYDHNNAIGGLSTKYGFSNSNFINSAKYDAATPDIQMDTILLSNLPSYSMYNLRADVVPGATTIMSGPAWSEVLKTLPIPFTSIIDANSPTGFDVTYIFDGAKILNADVISKAQGANPPLDNPYFNFRDTTTSRFQNEYYSGGSLGFVEFTGDYQSIANGSVQLPLKQSVQVFLPPIPVVEYSQESSYDKTDPLNLPYPLSGPPSNQGTPVYCQSGGAISLQGWPAPSSGKSKGYFVIIDADPAHVDTLYFKNLAHPIRSVLPAGVTDFTNGTMSIDPDKFNFGFHDIKIVYNYQDDNSPIGGNSYQIIRITPNPVADFTYTTLCEDLPVVFTDKSTVTTAPGVTIAKWDWDFADANSSSNKSTLQSPSHTYDQFGAYPNVRLDVTTNVGCKSVTPKTIDFQIGGTPEVNFTFKGVSTEDSITFNSTSKVFNDLFAKMVWSFGDNKTQRSDYNDVIQPSNPSADFIHGYKTANRYTVNLEVTSKIGCINNKSQDIIVLARAAALTPTTSYQETFENDNGMWQASSIPTSSSVTNPSSWTRGTPTTSVIKIDPDINDNVVWKTSLDAGYNPLERSALYSPSFDLSELTRPMISFNSFVQVETSDGVVLEYSVDDKNVADPDKKWFTLGHVSEGVDWFTDQSITAKPGSYEFSKDIGWSGSGKTEWQLSKHALISDPNDENKPAFANAKSVVFRFALASAKQDASLLNGFAIDNVRIGNRTRIVLVENFRNLSNTETPAGRSVSNEQHESEYLKSFNPSGTDSSVVKINYHVGFPGVDPFNLDNQQDAGARALYYNISKTPRVQLDGAFPTDATDPLFSAWGENVYNKSSLTLADAKIVPIIEKDDNGNSIGIKVNVTALKNLGENTILHVAVVEKSIEISKLSSDMQKLVKTGETSFKYVVKKLLPDAAGTRFGTALPHNETRTFPETDNFVWPTLPFYSVDSLAIVMFLQDEDSKVVFQTEIVNLKDPAVVTGIVKDPEQQFSVFPNPADHDFTIVLPHPVTKHTMMRLYDQVGKVMTETYFEKGESRKTVNTTDYAAGIYLIQIEGDKGMLRHKMMVLHHN